MVLLFTDYSFSSSAMNDVVQGCESPEDQVTARICLEAEKEKAEQKLIELEKKMRATINAWDEEKSYRESALAKFESSVLTFREYVESACGFDESAAAGGNGASSMRSACVVELLDTRARMLDERIGWFK